MFILLFVIIGILLLFYGINKNISDCRENENPVEGGYKGSTLDNIMEYIEPYLLETDGKVYLHKYLSSHFDYKDIDELKDLIRKIIRDKSIGTITDFLEISQLTYGCFLDDKEKCDLYSNDIIYEVLPEDYDHLVKEGRDLLDEMGLKYKYDDSELRRIFRKNMDSWKKLKFKRPPTADQKYELDKFAFRVYLRNYIKTFCMSEKSKIEELKRLLSSKVELFPYYSERIKNATSMEDVIRMMKEMKDLGYLRADQNLETLALNLGVDLESLRRYKQLYPGLTIDQILRKLVGASEEIVIKKNKEVEELIEE